MHIFYKRANCSSVPSIANERSVRFWAYRTLFARGMKQTLVCSAGAPVVEGIVGPLGEWLGGSVL